MNTKVSVTLIKAALFLVNSLIKAAPILIKYAAIIGISFVFAGILIHSFSLEASPLGILLMIVIMTGPVLYTVVKAGKRVIEIHKLASDYVRTQEQSDTAEKNPGEFLRQEQQKNGQHERDQVE